MRRLIPAVLFSLSFTLALPAQQNKPPVNPPAPQKNPPAKEAPKPPKATWLWVVENHETGLLVGHYDIEHRNVGGSSIGNGNRGYTFEVRTKNYRYAWIPHNPATKEMANGDSLHALVSPAGTHRLDETTVVPQYKFHGIAKDEKPKK